MIPTGWQIREGRHLIGMSQADLAIAASVGLAVVVRAEMAVHIPIFTRRDSAAIQTALARHIRRDGAGWVASVA